MRLFIDAAWRRRDERRRRHRRPCSVCRTSRTGAPPLGLIVAAVLGVAALAGIVGWLMGHHGSENLPVATAPAPAVSAAKPAASPAPQPAVDTALKDFWHAPTLRSRAATGSCRPGNSAADLYRQALERHPGDAQALAGLDKVVDQLLSAAEQDLLAQHLDEAEH